MKNIFNWSAHNLEIWTRTKEKIMSSSNVIFSTKREVEWKEKFYISGWNAFLWNIQFSQSSKYFLLSWPGPQISVWEGRIKTTPGETCILLASLSVPLCPGPPVCPVMLQYSLFELYSTLHSSRLHLPSTITSETTSDQSKLIIADLGLFVTAVSTPLPCRSVLYNIWSR